MYKRSIQHVTQIRLTQQIHQNQEKVKRSRSSNESGKKKKKKYSQRENKMKNLRVNTEKVPNFN
jgi:hypothetical protein